MGANAAAKRGQGAPPRRGEEARGRALKVPKTSELIADWLREHVRQARLAPGDPLPSEEDLKRRFAASRPTVREAMRILEAQQLVRITRGATGGARYTVPDAAMVAEHTGIYLEAHGATQADMNIARINIEPCILGFIADMASAKDIQRLAASAERQGSWIDDQARFSQEHENFYAILAEICSNLTLSMLLRILRELMHAQMEVMGNVLMYGGAEARKGRLAHVRAKQKLAELLRARDRDGVERWWRRHLRAQYEELAASGRGDVTLKAPRRSS